MTPHDESPQPSSRTDVVKSEEGSSVKTETIVQIGIVVVLVLVSLAVSIILFDDSIAQLLAVAGLLVMAIGVLEVLASLVKTSGAITTTAVGEIVKVLLEKVPALAPLLAGAFLIFLGALFEGYEGLGMDVVTLTEQAAESTRDNAAIYATVSAIASPATVTATPTSAATPDTLTTAVAYQTIEAGLIQLDLLDAEAKATIRALDGTPAGSGATPVP